MTRATYVCMALIAFLLTACTHAGGAGPGLPEECVTQVLGPAASQHACFGQAATSLRVYDGTGWRIVEDVRYVHTYGNLNAAVADIGTRRAALVLDRPFTAETVTIPGTMILVRISGGELSVNPGHTVTLAGAVIADEHQLFSGGGNVRCAAPCLVIPVSPKWFGATGDGTTNDQNAFRKTYAFLTNSSGKVYIPAGTYLLNPGATPGNPLCTVSMAGLSGIETYGEGWGAELKLTDLGTVFCLGDGRDLEFHHVKFSGINNGGATGGYSGLDAQWHSAFDSQRPGGNGTFGGRHIAIHHVHFYKLGKCSFMSFGTEDWEFHSNRVESVHACLQSGGGVPPAGYNTHADKIHIHHNEWLSDPQGADDMIAIGWPAADWDIHDNVLDGGNSAGHSDPKQRPDCLYIENGSVDGTTNKTVQVKFHHNICRNNSGTHNGGGSMGADVSRAGIFINPFSSTARIEDLQITDNTFERVRIAVDIPSTYPGSVVRLAVARNTVHDTSASGMRICGTRDARILENQVVDVGRRESGHAYFITAAINMEFNYNEGRGADNGGLGVQWGYPLSGKATHNKMVGMASDGFWFPATDITGRFEFTDNIAENNGRYGFNGNNRVTARNGLVLRNNTGSGNKAGLFNGF